MVQFETYITIISVHYRSRSKKVHLVGFDWGDGITQYRKSACRSFILKGKVAIFRLTNIRSISEEAYFVRCVARPVFHGSIYPTSIYRLPFLPAGCT